MDGMTKNRHWLAISKKLNQTQLHWLYQTLGTINNCEEEKRVRILTEMRYVLHNELRYKERNGISSEQELKNRKKRS